MNEETKYEGWAVLELMGHVKLAGFVTEGQLAGQGMLHLAIPDGMGGNFEQYIPPASLYRMTTVSESIARRVARQAMERAFPVTEWDVRTEIREKIAAEEREDIEKRVRRQVAIERSAEDRGLPGEAVAVYTDNTWQDSPGRYGDDDEDDDL